MILLYGRPASGKTRIAKELRDRLGCEWVSVDEIRDALGIGAATLAQAELIHKAREADGDLIVECCRPHPRLLDEATLVVEVEASNQTISQRLTARGWSRGHIGRALAECYAVTPDVLVVPENPDPAATILTAYANRRSNTATATT